MKVRRRRSLVLIAVPVEVPMRSSSWTESVSLRRRRWSCHNWTGKEWCCLTHTVDTTQGWHYHIILKSIETSINIIKNFESLYIIWKCWPYNYYLIKKSHKNVDKKIIENVKYFWKHTFFWKDYIISKQFTNKDWPYISEISHLIDHSRKKGKLVWWGSRSK